jgi:acid phosphatase class B
MLCALLEDRREIRVPLEYYPGLKNATAKQRKNYQIIGNGTGIHWSDIDEDLSVKAIIEGQPSRF